MMGFIQLVGKQHHFLSSHMACVPSHCAAAVKFHAFNVGTTCNVRVVTLVGSESHNSDVCLVSH